MVLTSMRAWQNLKYESLAHKTIGLVPTMGNLHQGHLSLCQRSMQENDVTVVTIYVNPTQFNDPQDLQAYPRTLEQDLVLLNAQAVDYCLVLTDEEMYADGYHYQMHESNLSHVMEGQYRKGHFAGVLTIVLKLLCGIAATRAYFGEKDYQQYLLIKHMQQSFFLNTEIVVCATIREPSGLPYSSRNGRLTVVQRKLAEQFAQIFLQKNSSCAEIKQQIMNLDMVVDYCEEHWQRRFVAVRLGSVRLSDNYALEE